MSNRPGPSTFIPSDKNIYDAIQLKKIRHSEALRFLRSRGILVSSSLDKAELSKIISSLTLDYHDFKHIKKLLENPNRKEKTTNSIVKACTNNEQLVQACKDLSSRAKNEDSYKIIKKDDSTLLIVTYTDVDFTKTELTQRSLKRCEIELQANDGSVSIRRPATKKGQDVTESLKLILTEIIGGETLEEEALSLEGITLPAARSEFFDVLIQSIVDHDLEDVSSVVVHHETDTLEDEPIEDEDDHSSSKYAGFISKASLAGGGVLESAEFNQLNHSEFFISKIVWTVVDSLPNGDKIELEAQFGSPSSCTDFKYLVRAIYNYNERTRMHNISSRTPSRVETNAYNKRLEKAAKLAFDHVARKYMEPEDEND